MPPLDLRSLTIMAGLMGMAMGMVLLGLRRNYPASIQGMTLWGIAPLLCGTSTVFYGLDGYLPAALVALGGNALLLTGVGLFHLGSRRFYHLAPAWQAWACGGLAVMATLAFFLTAAPDYRVRVLVFTGAMAVVVAAHVLLLLRHGEGFAPRFTAYVLALQAAVLVARAITTLWIDSAHSNRFGPSLVQTAYIAAYSFSVLLVSIGVLLMASERVRAQLEYLATHDSLTGTLARRAILQHGSEEMLRWQRYRNPFSVLLLDIDHFKAVNDRHGHLVGDRVLAEFARIATESLRSTDRIGRYGGEEFVVLLAETEATAAFAVAERIRQGLRAMPEGLPACTTSIGVATVLPGQTRFDEVLARADAALYQAKDQGRNATVAA